MVGAVFITGSFFIQMRFVGNVEGIKYVGTIYRRRLLKTLPQIDFLSSRYIPGKKNKINILKLWRVCVCVILNLENEFAIGWQLTKTGTKYFVRKGMSILFTLQGQKKTKNGTRRTNERGERLMVKK